MSTKPKGLWRIWRESKRAFRMIYSLRADWMNFKRMTQGTQRRFECHRKDLWESYAEEDFGETVLERHYRYHPVWAARVLAKTQPQRHIDIGSALMFSTLASAFIPMGFYDYRPASLELKGLTTGHADVMSLPFTSNSVASLSCMHVMEHVGLGRYGDPIDYDGDLKGMRELARVLAPGGNLLFVVPVGAEAIIQFNAHRIFTPSMITQAFSDEGLQLQEFVLIPEKAEDGSLVLNPSEELLQRQQHACGCFWLTKKRSN